MPAPVCSRPRRNISHAVAVFLGVVFAQERVVGVDFDDLAGFGVLDGQQADGGQLLFARVGEGDANEVVAAVGQGERAEEVAAARRRRVGQFAFGALEEIGDEEDDGAAAQEAVGVIERVDEVGAAALRGEAQDVADDAQDVLAAFLRVDEFLHAVGEEAEADLVLVAGGGEGEDAGDFSGEFALAGGGGAEGAGGAAVDEEHEGQLAFLAEFFDERAGPSWR